MYALRVRFLQIILLTFVLSRCGVDNDQTQVELIGSWILEQQDTNECEDPENGGSEGFVCSSIACSRLIFSDSSIYQMESTSEGLTSTESGTYAIDGALLVLCTEGDEEEQITCSDFSMILENNTLIINGVDKIDGCFVRRRYARN